MPISLDESKRPKRMVRDHPALEIPDPCDDLFYRHCPAEQMDGLPDAPVVTEAAVKQLGLSVLWSAFADPDDARWESAKSLEGKREARVYPESFVIQVPIQAIRLISTPSKPEASPHSCRPAHAPFPDNYAHSEIHLYRNATGELPEKYYEKSSQLTPEAKLALRLLRQQIVAVATVALEPFQGTIFSAEDISR